MGDRDERTRTGLGCFQAGRSRGTRAGDRHWQEPNNSAAMNGEQRSGSLGNKNASKPKGGFDSTPIPNAPAGYTIRILFHRATNLPISDLNSLSSDPYVVAQLDTDLAMRHKEDPPLQLRTPTVRRSVNPVWEYDWIVANVPQSGFRLKARVFDEDPADRDDRLGNAHVHVNKIDENWAGIADCAYPLRKRMASKRAYLMRCAAVVLSLGKVKFTAFLHISVQVLGPTESDSNGRAYTLGPNWWTRHYSPLLGLMTGSKGTGRGDKKKKDRKPERYNFQASQFQLQGPVPAELYHRYVEFRPMIKSMFTKSGINGLILNRTLHRQHKSVYRFDRATARGKFEKPCPEMAMHFLDLVHYGTGNRLFTYVITLDSLMRFTETGKEFGIDFLSKHTLHSNVSVYIAYSGEFFVRRRLMRHQRKQSGLSTNSGKSPISPTSPTSLKSPKSPKSPRSPKPRIFSFWRWKEVKPPIEKGPNKDPSQYELVIDNDSGTYRPNGELLPLLKKFLEHNFPGLHVKTLDSQADAEEMNKLKGEQRARKRASRHHMVYRQVSDSSSSSSSGSGLISSSDEEELRAATSADTPEAGGVEETRTKEGKGVLKQIRADAVTKERKKKGRFKDFKPGHRERHKQVMTAKTDGVPDIE